MSKVKHCLAVSKGEEYDEGTLDAKSIDKARFEPNPVRSDSTHLFFGSTLSFQGVRNV